MLPVRWLTGQWAVQVCTDRAVERGEHGADLQQTARWFSIKMGLFGNNQDLRLETGSLMAKHANLKNRGEECSFTDLGGAIVIRVHWRKQKF